MEFEKIVNGTETRLIAKGKLDSVGSGEFSEEVKGITSGMKTVILDFGDVDYISSAGLRAVLKLKVGAKNTEIFIENAHGMTKELFETAGFGMILR